MTVPEAEVIALRLRDSFNRFSLDAYPSCFAGVPKQTLQTLLQANRRSELIQLAVDGFLMFMVADDKANVTLNRMAHRLSDQAVLNANLTHILLKN